MLQIQAIAEYCTQRLDTDSFDDYCPNGLQVDAGEPVRKLVSGVTASEALIDAAIAANADALLVHHGYFWKGEPAPLIGIKGKRVKKLMCSGLSLLAYHLPLDAHAELGNNCQLGERLGFVDSTSQDASGLLWGATLASPESAAALHSRIATALARSPLHLPGGAESIGRVAWCSGAAHDYITRAAEAGFDAFISGEVSEQTMHLAKELGIHYFCAGHHATERYGVQALGEELAKHFQIEYEYIDIENPV